METRVRTKSSRRESNMAAPESVCGDPNCKRMVKTGIECTNCRSWYHSTCTPLDTSSFRAHLQQPMKPWFCNRCQENSFIRSLVTLTAHYESQLALCNQELSKLRCDLDNLRSPTRINAKATATATTSPPAPRTKRQRTQETTPSKTGTLRTTDKSVDSPLTAQMNPQNPPPEVSKAAQTAPLAVTQTDGPTGQNKAHRTTPSKINMSNKTTRHHETTTVVCSKFPEPCSTSLASRRDEDLKYWNKLCQIMGVSANPISMTRLSRKSDSPHANEARMLRVTLSGITEVETVLLASYILKGVVETRIHPDTPWSTRISRKTLEPQEAKKEKNDRSLLIHGVPELADVDPGANHLHDCGEWSYIQHTLKLSDIMATDIYRLPRSPAYRGMAPRILKITLLTKDMLSNALDIWYHQKHLLPELRIRPHLPKKGSPSIGLTPPGDLTPDNPTNSANPLDANYDSAQSKNDNSPAQAGPASLHQ